MFVRSCTFRIARNRMTTNIRTATLQSATTPREFTNTRESHNNTHNQSTAWRRRIAYLGIGGTVGLVASIAANNPSELASPHSGSTAGLTTVACAATSSRSDWPPPILSTSKIYSRLQSPQEQIHQVQRGIVKEYHVNQHAANPIIEDTVAVVPSLQCPPGGFLAGVFDGHSGKDASKWCSEELLAYLQYYRWSARTDQVIHKRTFLEADHHFLEMALRDQRYQAGLSGACLNVAHVSGTTVRTANAGDCRTIVGRRVPRTNQSGGEKGVTQYKYQAIELTTDHQIDTNHLERERLLRDHPDEPDIIQKNRVKGRLQPTRGFGDGFYKRREFYNARTLNKPYAVWTPPYTTVEPDITTYDLQREDEFMVMASDGLFQDLNSQQVVEYVGDWLALQQAESNRSKGWITGQSANPSYTPNASTYLIKHALQHASEHAVGRRRKENENLSWIMQLPQEAKRNYHDDVSVIVVFFDHTPSRFPSDTPTLTSPAGPPVPPTLARAFSMHLKVPPSLGMNESTLPDNDGTVPIKIPPIQQETHHTTQTTNSHQQQDEKIRSKL